MVKTVIDITNFLDVEITRKKFNNMKLVPSGEANLLYQIDTINRRCFITEFMFNVEFFLHSILSKIQQFEKIKLYKEIIDDLNKRILKDDNKRNILYAPYLIRNSIHNNGQILKLNEEFIIKSKYKDYPFKKGLVTFVGWWDIVIFIEEMLSVLVELIESDKVKDIKFMISPYENEKTTGFDILDS